MSKLSQWKKILSQAAKPKVAVSVAGKSEQMTQTQSYRFEELNSIREDVGVSPDGNPLNESSYSLADAAMRLMVTEDDLLRQAAAGSTYLYIATAGLAGRWRCRAQDGSVVLSASQTLGAGFLALACAACGDLANGNGARITALSSTPRTQCAPAEAWIGQGERSGEPDLFMLAEPLAVGRDRILLLPPLTPS